ncbi:hypothetical protein F4778DRAFT_42578 [Xylariomycetidae sp. FL2044]|nr:hypothetical protein F4778DRAFT_42578 [Xylariomycetidae sp. FL2044]
MSPGPFLLLPALCASFGALAASSDCGFLGGFPLRTSGDCPSEAPVTCGVGLQSRCCPSGFACVGSYCCQSGQNCRADIEDHPQCPTTAWNLWAYNSNGSLGWCCDPNEFGFATLSNNAVGCQPIGQTIDTDSYHTVTQFFPQSTVCASTSTSTTSTSTSTTSTSTASSSGGSQITEAPPAESSSSAVSEGSSLSAGGIAGVAIGAVAGVALAGVAGWLVLRRRGMKRTEQRQGPQGTGMAENSKPPTYYPPASVSEAPDTSLYEMPAGVDSEVPRAHTGNPKNSGYYQR